MQVFCAGTGALVRSVPTPDARSLVTYTLSDGRPCLACATLTLGRGLWAVNGDDFAVQLTNGLREAYEFPGTLETCYEPVEGRPLVVVESLRGLVVVDGDSGEMLHHLPGHRGSSRLLVYYQPGTDEGGRHPRVVRANRDGTMGVIDPLAGLHLFSLRGHQAWVSGLATFEQPEGPGQGTYIISGSEDRTVKVWHGGNGRLCHTLEVRPGTTSWVLAVAGYGRGEGRHLAWRPGAQRHDGVL
jgi:WD40 repeat protein